MEIGKIPTELLQKILQQTSDGAVKRKEILVRPHVGEDCTVLDLGNERCLLSTDPITGASENIGYLAVHVNCNDLASCGAEPIGIMLTLLLPPGATEEQTLRILADARRAADEIGIEIIGGHTEVTDAVIKPVLSATVVGKSIGQKYVKTGGALPEQDVIMTKWAGLEGTSILASDYESYLIKAIGLEKIKKAQSFAQYLSVIPESKIAVSHGATAMHDVTEGGILGAAWEVAESSGTGIEIDIDKIPLSAETEEICKLFQIDPYRLISSGCMIITSFEGEALVKKLEAQKISSAIIGKVTHNGRRKIIKGETSLLVPPDSDEIYKIKIPDELL